MLKATLARLEKAGTAVHTSSVEVDPDAAAPSENIENEDEQTSDDPGPSSSAMTSSSSAAGTSSSFARSCSSSPA